MPLFSWVHQEVYQKIFSYLPDPMGMRFVGGAVRNSLLGIPFDDIDFATIYRPEEITDFFESQGCKVIPTGIEHGTVTVLCGGQSYEITTLRRDVETDGRHAIVAYTSEWEDDAKRRDFTMNALYVDYQGRLYDCVGGQQDIQQRLIRFIGDPEQRIREDYLRIVRFFRFWALYGHSADSAGLNQCCALKHHLSELSSERITKEMVKLLSATNPWSVIRCLQDYGFDSLLWGHSTQMGSVMALQGVEKILGQSPMWVRLAALTGKMPQRLTFSNEQKKHLNLLWRPLLADQGVRVWSEIHHDVWIAALNSVYDYGLALTKERLWMMGFLYVQNHIDQSDLDKSSADQNVRYALEDGCGVFLQACQDLIKTLDRTEFPSFSLSGRDVMALGVSGPKIGRVLSQTKAWWVENEMRPMPEACLRYAKILMVDIHSK